MAGSNTGPLGTTPPRIDDGTLPGTTPPLPGPVGVAGVLDPVIEALHLRGAARRAAYALKRAHPSVTFTSGLRTKEDQARAMASNVVTNRKWIGQTYRPGTVCDACQRWVDDHPEAKTKEQIAAGLLSVMKGASDVDVAKLSKHLTGDAFDVQPVTANAEAIKATIRSLDGLDKFLDKEGGLVRWHAQF